MKNEVDDSFKSWSKFAKIYDPIKCASIDGTDCEPHDRAVIRAINSEYRPNRFVKGKPECTIFVSRLNHNTSKDTIKELFSKYGKLKRFRMVKDIVTGMPKGYAFVEYEEESEADDAYRLANRMVVDGNMIFVDFECERLLKGWKPRRLGGGFAGKKESGQLRFGGRDRPFKKPITLEIKEQEEKRRKDRERRANEDKRRRRDKSHDRHRRKSPARENGGTSPNQPKKRKRSNSKEEKNIKPPSPKDPRSSKKSRSKSPPRDNALRSRSPKKATRSENNRSIPSPSKHNGPELPSSKNPPAKKRRSKSPTKERKFKASSPKSNTSPRNAKNQSPLRENESTQVVMKADIDKTICDQKQRWLSPIDKSKLDSTNVKHSGGSLEKQTKDDQERRKPSEPRKKSPETDRSRKKSAPSGVRSVTIKNRVEDDKTNRSRQSPPSDILNKKSRSSPKRRPRTPLGNTAKNLPARNGVKSNSPSIKRTRLHDRERSRSPQRVQRNTRNVSPSQKQRNHSGERKRSPIDRRRIPQARPRSPPYRPPLERRHPRSPDRRKPSVASTRPTGRSGDGSEYLFHRERPRRSQERKGGGLESRSPDPQSRNSRVNYDSRNFEDHRENRNREYASPHEMSPNMQYYDNPQYKYADTQYPSETRGANHYGADASYNNYSSYTSNQRPEFVPISEYGLPQRATYDYQPESECSERDRMACQQDLGNFKNRGSPDRRNPVYPERLGNYLDVNSQQYSLGNLETSENYWNEQHARAQIKPDERSMYRSTLENMSTSTVNQQLRADRHSFLRR